MISKEDKLNQFIHIKKNINNLCFNNCYETNFNNNKQNVKLFDLNNRCSKICYEKYLKVADIVLKETIKKGKDTKSEIISKLYNPNRDFYEEKLIFPDSGIKIFTKMRPFLYYNNNYPIYLRKGVNEFET